MSRAITVETNQDPWNKVIQWINAMKKVPLPKADEIVPLSSLEFSQEWSKDFSMCTEAFMPSDHSLGDPTLDTMGDIEPDPLPAPEICGTVEALIPLEFPIQTPQERTSKRPVATVPRDEIANPAILDRSPAREKPVKKNLETRELENLLAAFKESGMNVKEVKALPSGATRITFDEFFGQKQKRQLEFARTRGHR